MTNLLVCGDSWTFGSEIRDPSLPEHIKDWDIDNNSYLPCNFLSAEWTGIFSILSTRNIS